MKKFFGLVLIFFMSFFQAQGNLQFNQTLLLNASSNSTAQWTVPAGKTVEVIKYWMLLPHLVFLS